MKKIVQLIVPIALLFYGCNTNTKEDAMEKWKKEIVETEREFAELAQKEGIPKAFLTYAAADVVIKKGKNVIIGKDALREHYKNQKPELENVSLTWKPDFVDVASSGDLGYTYGNYVYTRTDSIGNVTKDSGIFHTVWKRQTDGKWRFVWD